MISVKAQFWSNPNATGDWPFISKKVLSGLFPQARLLGEALEVAVATLLPALPRMSLGWAAPETKHSLGWWRLPRHPEND